MLEQIRRELGRLGYLAGEDNPKGLAAEPGGSAGAVRLDGGWFSAVYDAARLLAVLRRLRPTDRLAYPEGTADNGFLTEPEFWGAVRPSELPEPARPRHRHEAPF
jgi:hypothetical protein